MSEEPPRYFYGEDYPSRRQSRKDARREPLPAVRPCSQGHRLGTSRFRVGPLVGSMSVLVDRCPDCGWLAPVFPKTLTAAQQEFLAELNGYL